MIGGYYSKNKKLTIIISLIVFVSISIIFTTYLGFFQQKSIIQSNAIIPNSDLDKTTNSSFEFGGSDSSSGGSSSSGGGGSSSSHSSSNNNINTEKVAENNLFFTNDSILKNLTKDKGDYISVIVILKDQTMGVTNKNDLSKAKSVINNQEDKVLSEFNKSEFLLKYKYNTINGFTGKIKKENLEELRQNPNVKAVYEDKLLHVTLTESVPLINADDLWDLGITGNGSVVCVVDTGIDYTHPDLGNCTSVWEINGNTVPYSLDSPHPYDNDYNNTWTITQPGFSNIAVHFSEISVENYYDYVYIMDVNDNIIQSFSGYYTDVWSVSVPGDTIKIRFVTDYSVTGWGFAIDNVLNGTADFSLNNCNKVIDGYDFVNGDNDPMDDYGHGTHVAGIVAANGTIKGVAPDAKLLAVKVCDAYGGCWDSDIIAGVDWCNSKSGTYNIVATTMSLGDGGEYNRATCPTWMDDVINATHDLGIAVTVASGSEEYSNGISYPACSPNAISVGSTNKSDVISWSTNTGELLDILAPGENIYSTLPGNDYWSLSGTSMATPHVAGVIALLKQYSTSISPDRVRTVLKTTGVPILDPRNGLTFPRVDALAALRNITGIKCFSNSGCGTDYSFGAPFCQSGNIWKNWVVYTCNNPGTTDSYCSDSISSLLNETCSNGCVDGRCKVKVCKTICNYGRCQEYCSYQ